MFKQPVVNTQPASVRLCVHFHSASAMQVEQNNIRLAKWVVLYIYGTRTTRIRRPNFDDLFPLLLRFHHGLSLSYASSSMPSSRACPSSILKLSFGVGYVYILDVVDRLLHDRN